MLKRCYKPHVLKYEYYGGLGIFVCDEWKNDFTKFRDWAMANGYNDNLTIDRIDVMDNYYPENCRWIPFKDQQANKKNTVYVDDIPLVYLYEQRKVDITYGSFAHRIKNGWDLEDALSIPKYGTAPGRIK